MSNVLDILDFCKNNCIDIDLKPEVQLFSTVFTVDLYPKREDKWVSTDVSTSRPYLLVFEDIIPKTLTAEDLRKYELPTIDGNDEYECMLKLTRALIGKNIVIAGCAPGWENSIAYDPLCTPVKIVDTYKNISLKKPENKQDFNFPLKYPNNLFDNAKNCTTPQV